MTKSAEQIIRDADRISEFLKDEVIAGALSRMERRIYEEFQAADSSEKRVTTWAKSVVLRDFETELRSIIDAGEREVLNPTTTKR
jgi:hypothetical protein